MLIHVHTRERCRSCGRKWLQPLTGSKFSMDLWPAVAVPRHRNCVSRWSAKGSRKRLFPPGKAPGSLSLSLSLGSFSYKEEKLKDRNKNYLMDRSKNYNLISLKRSHMSEPSLVLQPFLILTLLILLIILCSFISQKFCLSWGFVAFFRVIPYSTFLFLSLSPLFGIHKTGNSCYEPLWGAGDAGLCI